MQKEGFGEFYSEYFWGMPAKFVVVAESAYALALTRFLINDLGLMPGGQFITENPPEEYREAIRRQFQTIASDVVTDVAFEEDSYRIHTLLRQTDFGQPPPSSWGRPGNVIWPRR